MYNPRLMRGAGFIFIVTLGLVLAIVVRAEAPATQASATGAVRGTITAATGGPLPEMVVYLEPIDSGVSFAAPEEPAIISQKGAKFSPSLLVIAVGQAVEFHNDEDRPIEHNVFSRSPAHPFDLGLYPPPDERTVVFDKPGPVKLFCSIHRYMEGMIFVCPTPYFAKVAENGSWSIEGVPPGEYRLRTWQRSARFHEQVAPARVDPGKDLVIDLEMQRG